jgi:hypothetical protein
MTGKWFGKESQQGSILGLMDSGGPPSVRQTEGLAVLALLALDDVLQSP